MKGLRRRIAAFIVSAFAAGFAAAQECPPTPQPFTPDMFQPAATTPDRGPLWKISRDGAVSYLHGTLHVGRRDWLPAGPAISRALRESDVVALELDPLDIAPQAVAAYKPRRGEAPLPPPLRERMEAVWRAECLPATVRIGPPEFQAASLMSFVGRRDGFDAAYGSEIYLAIAARAGQRRVVSLESIELQLRALEAGSHAEAEAMVGEMLQEIESGRARRMLARMAAAWESADMARLEDYEKWCECMETEAERRLMRRLLDDRNPHLAERIAQLHGSSGKVLAAVGTLHMVGPRGLPALLKARGFSVERVR